MKLNPSPLRMILVSLALMIASASFGAGCAPADSMTAEKLLDRWAQSLGGRERLEQVRNSYLYATTSEGGLKGTLQEWSASDGRYRRRYERIGVDSTLTVYNGKQAWLRDWNGYVHTLEGADLKSVVTDACVKSCSFPVGRGLTGKVELLGEDESKTLQVLRLRPDSGREVTFYIDRLTFLPVRSERRNEDSEQITYYSDWRDVEGVKVPFTIRQSSGDPRYDLTMSVVNVTFNLDDIDEAFWKPSGSAFDSRIGRGEGAFKTNNNFILLQGTINGSKPLWFLFDTGASMTVINKDRAKELGIPLHGELQVGTSASSTGLSIARGVSLNVSGAEVVNQTVGAVSLKLFEMGLGLPIGGILGFDFISRFIVGVDSVQRTIRFYSPKTFGYTGNGKIIPFTLEGGRPFVTARLGLGDRELDSRLEIDTGETRTVFLNSPFVKENGLLPGPGRQKVSGAEATSTNYVNSLNVNARLKRLQIGPFEIQDVPAGLSLAEGGFVSNPDYSGLLGNAILNRFRVILDYARRQMILEPAGDLHRPFPPRRTFGALIIAEGERLDLFRIARVTPGSPADQSGLRAGDVVASMNGRPAPSLTLEEIQQTLSRENEEVRLEVKRGDKVLKLRVTVRLVEEN
jgi:hypothetical protein